jgi:methylated-DNA-[protein]-cysteine S-methyltransferase
VAASLRIASVATPIGEFRVVYRERTVHLVDLLERGVEPSPVPADALRDPTPFTPDSPPRQLREYFRGRRRVFDLDIRPWTGSEFDLRVWRTLAKVPAGETVTYGELARRSGFPGSARAVGGSMARNPVPIVVPCHRVVGQAGSLVGFGLGMWRKRWLLDHEGAWPLKSKSPFGPRDPAQRTFDSLRDLRDEPRDPRRAARAPPASIPVGAPFA